MRSFTRCCRRETTPASHKSQAKRACGCDCVCAAGQAFSLVKLSGPARSPPPKGRAERPPRLPGGAGKAHFCALLGHIEPFFRPQAPATERNTKVPLTPKTPQNSSKFQYFVVERAYWNARFFSALDPVGDVPLFLCQYSTNAVICQGWNGLGSGYV